MTGALISRQVILFTLVGLPTVIGIFASLPGIVFASCAASRPVR